MEGTFVPQFNGLAQLLNNRELATVLWLSVVGVACLLSKKIRASLGQVGRSLVQPSLLATSLSMGIYVAVLVWLGHVVGLWSAELISETVWWFAGTGLVLLFNMNDARKERGFFRRAALQTFSITLFLEFFMNDLFVLSLPFELILLPTLTALGLVWVVAQSDSAHRQVASLTGCLQAMIGLGIAAFVVFKVLTDWNQVTTEAHLLEFLLPVWLTLAFLPFLYVVSVLLSYRSAFRRIDSSLGDQRSSSWHVKLALVTVLRGRTRDAAAFIGGWVNAVAAARSFREARKVIKDYRASRKKREEAEKEARDRLDQYAAVEGTDSDGLQLDRREFIETKAALRSLAAARWVGTETPGADIEAICSKSSLQSSRVTVSRGTTASLCVFRGMVKPGTHGGGPSPDGVFLSGPPLLPPTSGSSTDPSHLVDSRDKMPRGGITHSPGT